jgi:hypothetical protein
MYIAYFKNLHNNWVYGVVSTNPNFPGFLINFYNESVWMVPGTVDPNA